MISKDMDTEWRYEPASLQSYCFDCVVTNSHLLLGLSAKHSTTLWSDCLPLHDEFQSRDLAAACPEVAADLVPSHTECVVDTKNQMKLCIPLAEKLLSKLSLANRLTDDTLRAFIKLYNYPYRRLHFHNVGNVLTIGGMLSLGNLHLRELTLNVSPSASSIKSWNVKDLISAFRHSCSSLRTLEICLSRVSGGGDIVDFIATFPNLKVLILKSEIRDGCAFDCVTWERIFSACRHLEYLNVTFPGVFKEIVIDSSIFYRFGKDSLKSLGLYGALSLDRTVESYDSLTQFAYMNVLTHLDLSIDIPDLFSDDVYHHDDNLAKKQETMAKRVEQLLDHGKDGLPRLVSLDISGLSSVNDMYLDAFLDTHSNMAFLGLCLTKSRYCLNDILPEATEVTGVQIEKHIFASLRLYPGRATYLKEALKGLFHISSDWRKRRPDIIQVVLRSMQDHPSNVLLQMAGTACLYNLTREREDLQGTDVHITLLNKTAELTAAALASCVGTIQIVKNCLLIFCNDRILHQATFDRYNMIRRCLDCMSLISESTDRHVTRMAVAIVSILACKITSHETASLTTEKDMKLLLEILRRRIQLGDADGTMKFDLSALWNLTDESPKACEMFVSNGGMDLYVNILQTFDDHSIQTKILGLLNNIAEVEYLLDTLLRMDLMNFVRNLICSEHVAVSYFSAGIIANLLFVWRDEWSTRLLPKQELASKLEQAVKKWGTLTKSVVGYRSFRPFLNLLVANCIPEVQTWAVWAIHHVCSLNPQRYADVLTDECYSLLVRLRESASCSDDMRKRIDEICKVSKRTVIFN